MKILPITVSTPAIVPLLAGRLTRLYRPLGQLADIEAGDLLWLREPFFLDARHDNLSPTQAVERHRAVPRFAEGLARGGAAMLGLGKRRPARLLPRALHRVHLAVTAVERLPLRSIPPAQMRAEGFASPAHWVDAWDKAALQFPGAGRGTWSDNPDVIGIAFTLQRRPAPTPAADAPEDK